VQAIDLEKYGSKLEHHPIFPQRANIGIAEIVAKNEIKLRVWERGSGETLACGSGACAAVAAGVRRELLSNKVLVHLQGGDLQIEIIESGDIMMTGPVAIVFTGVIEL
jgi:diaminopimelate epimerase